VELLRHRRSRRAQTVVRFRNASAAVGREFEKSINSYAVIFNFQAVLGWQKLNYLRVHKLQFTDHLAKLNSLTNVLSAFV
jgi:hypothetical protein